MAIEITYAAQKPTDGSGSAQLRQRADTTTHPAAQSPFSLTVSASNCLCCSLPAALCTAAVRRGAAQLGSSDPATTCQLPSFVVSVLSQLQSRHPQSIQRLLDEKLPPDIRLTLQRYAQGGGHTHGNSNSNGGGAHHHSHHHKLIATTPLSPQPPSLSAPRPIHTSSSHPSLNAFHTAR